MELGAAVHLAAVYVHAHELNKGRLAVCLLRR
jgi:hypothetical protein